MISSNNTTILCGNVVEAPTMRKAGEADVCTVRLAVNTSKTTTMFIDVECWRNNAEFATKYFKKGSFVGVVGQLKSRQYEKDSVKHTVFFIDAENIGFGSPPPKKEDGEDSPAPAKSEAKPAAKSTPKPAPKADNDNLPF